MSEARHQFEVNVFGLARLTQLVLPHMRQRQAGRVINVSSMGGKIYTPLGGWYHATKFAVEAFSDCLRIETEPFGINVVVIEPGGIKTEWGDIAADGLLEASGEGPYRDQARAMAKMLSSDPGSRQGSSPSVVANAVAEAVTVRRPKTRYAIGYGAKPLIAIRRLLPDRAYDKLITRVTRIPSQTTHM
jgi:short-subunit dehydrogenase